MEINELFNQEEIKRLQEISKLKGEEQKKELDKFLKTLKPEQIEFLKRQQGGECVFCNIANGKAESYKVYEDKDVIAVLDINPASPGHLLIFPKKHYQILNQMSESETGHIFKVVNKLSGVVFEAVKAEGTNVFVANGVVAGQNTSHIIIHVIPRFKDDKVMFNWEKADVGKEEMEEIVGKIKDKVRVEDVVEVKKEKEKIEEVDFESGRVP